MGKKVQAARERERLAKRQHEVAKDHLEYHKAKLQATKVRSDIQWDTLIEGFKAADLSYDSKAGSEMGVEDMSVAGENLDLQTFADPPAPSASLFPTPFQTPPPPPRKERKISAGNRLACLAGNQPHGTPFAATDATPFQAAAVAPPPPDGADAEALRIARIKEEGAKHNVREYLLQSAISHGITWEVLATDLQLGHEAAIQAARGITPNLNQLSPVSLHVADATYNEIVASQAASNVLSPTKKDPSSIAEEEMGAAGIQ